MVWSVFGTAFTDNLAAVAGYAADTGRPAPLPKWSGAVGRSGPS